MAQLPFVSAARPLLAAPAGRANVAGAAGRGGAGARVRAARGGGGGRRGGGGGRREVRAGRRVQGARGSARAAGGHRARRRGQLRRLLRRRLRHVAVPLHPRRSRGGELPAPRRVEILQRVATILLCHFVRCVMLKLSFVSLDWNDAGYGD